MDGIIDNLTNAIQTWNEKMAEIWLLLTQSPQEFKGGVIWEVIQNIHGALQSIGIALLVLFFVFGIVKTLTNMNEIKRPEQAFKLFVRFAIARGIVVYGMDLMLAIFDIIQGIISNIMTTCVRKGVLIMPKEVLDWREIQLVSRLTRNRKIKGTRAWRKSIYV